MSRARTLTAFASGLLFGIGLLVSGMTRPAKVVGFLDVLGAWDASLLFVMGGGIAVNLVALRWVRRRGAPLLDTELHLPTRKDIDAPLVVGATIFGMGWGLGGFCPGPALVTAASGAPVALAFVAAMTVGTIGARWLRGMR